MINNCIINWGEGWSLKYVHHKRTTSVHRKCSLRTTILHSPEVPARFAQNTPWLLTTVCFVFVCLSKGSISEPHIMIMSRAQTLLMELNHSRTVIGWSVTLPSSGQSMSLQWGLRLWRSCSFWGSFSSPWSRAWGRMTSRTAQLLKPSETRWFGAPTEGVGVKFHPFWHLTAVKETKKSLSFNWMTFQKNETKYSKV